LVGRTDRAPDDDCRVREWADSLAAAHYGMESTNPQRRETEHEAVEGRDESDQGAR
jgi:hypothetical protein